MDMSKRTSSGIEIKFSYLQWLSTRHRWLHMMVPSWNNVIWSFNQENGELLHSFKTKAVCMQMINWAVLGEYFSYFWVPANFCVLTLETRKVARWWAAAAKKLRGHFIHVSHWINEEDGRLVLRDNSGKIIHNAWKIIYPGSNSDPWWIAISSLYKCRKPSTYSIWPIPIVRLFLFLISHLCMDLYLLMHCELSTWTNQMRASSGNSATLLSHNLTHSPPFAVSPRRWPQTQVSQKAWSPFLKNGALMLPDCKLSACQCAQSRAKIAAWSNCSLSRKIFPTRSLCLRLSSLKPGIFALGLSMIMSIFKYNLIIMGWLWLQYSFGVFTPWPNTFNYHTITI